MKLIEPAKKPQSFKALHLLDCFLSDDLGYCIKTSLTESINLQTYKVNTHHENLLITAYPNATITLEPV